MKTIRVRSFGVGILCAAAAVMVTACGSDDSSNTSDGNAQESSAVPAEVVEKVNEFETPATEIVQPEIGLEPFTPKPGASIYNISCDLSNVSCTAIADNIQAGVEAIGYEYDRCDAGASPEAPNRCFTNAVDANPDVIVVNAVGADVAADGYAAAKEAGIPVVGAFTGDPGDGAVAETQVGAGGCEEQGEVLADAITVDSDGQANVLFATEDSIGCDVERENGFRAEFEKVCPDCPLEFLQFDAATIEQSLPQQLQAELNQNPDLNWIVGVFDPAASIAVTQVMQAGKQDSIFVAGMDGQPANIEFMLNQQVQKLDMAFAFASSPWSAVDAAARIYSGEEVPPGIPASQLLITWDNVEELGEEMTYNGPADYEEQFMALWGMS